MGCRQAPTDQVNAVLGTGIQPIAKFLGREIAQSGPIEPLDEFSSLLAKTAPVGAIAGRSRSLFEFVRFALQPRELLEPRRDRLAVCLVELLSQRRKALRQILTFAAVFPGAGLFHPLNCSPDVLLL